MAVTRRVAAVIFDWAGTIVDFGSRAPVTAFMKAFEAHGFPVTETLVRAHMGKSKYDHVKAMLDAPELDEHRQKQRDGVFAPETVKRVYDEFLSLQRDAAVERASPIPGALETFEWLRARERGGGEPGTGIRIGGCSGYTTGIMRPLRVAAARHGLKVDAFTCSDARDSNGRPKPWMSVHLARRLGVWPVWTCVKVDDTPVGVAEGVNAGMWSVGVVRSGNCFGMEETDVDALERSDPERYASLMREGVHTLTRAGAHFVVPSVKELPAVIEEVEKRLQAGVGPTLPPLQ